MKIIFCLSLLALSLTSFANIKPTESSLKEWTFMVYLNGDNSLDSAGDKDLREMMEVGSSDKVNIVVLRDFGARETTKIYYMNNGSVETVVDFKTNIDTGDSKTLVDFFKFAKEKYPAKKYLVDVWNHGGGWKILSGNIENKGISYDDTSGNYITTVQLGQAMAQMKLLNDNKNIEVLGMDACLMAMGEVIHEVHDSVNFVLGSEEVEPDDGWDYVASLSPLIKNPNMSTEAFLSNIVKTYVTQYSDAATLSAVSVSKFEKIIPLVNNFVAYSLANSMGKKDIFNAAQDETQSYDDPSYKDMTHFLKLISAKTSDRKLKSLASDLISGIQDSVVATAEHDKENSFGVSIWMPNYLGNDYDSYKELKWGTDTSWGSLLELLIK